MFFAFLAANRILTKSYRGFILQIEDVKKSIEESQGADYPPARQVIIFQGKVSSCNRDKNTKPNNTRYMLIIVLGFCRF